MQLPTQLITLRSQLLLIGALFAGACLTSCQPTSADPASGSETETGASEQAVAELDDAGTTKVSAENNAESNTRDAAPLLQISGSGSAVFTKRVHNFGKINDLDAAKCSFPFQVVGDRPVTFSKIKASCGCTSTQLKKMVYEPGESDEIAINWEPKGFGVQSKTVDVISDSAADGKLTLRITAEILPVVSFEPPQLQFGVVDHRQPHTMMLSAKSSMTSARVTSVRSSSPLLTTTIVPGSEGQDGRLALMKIDLSDQAKRGSFRSAVIVGLEAEVDGERRTFEKTINVSASVYGSIRATPDAFYVGRVDPQGVAENTLTLTHAKGQPFDVVRAEIQGIKCEGLKVDIVSQGPSKKLLVFNGPVGDYMGSLTGKVIVETDQPGDETFTFPVMGVVRAATPK